MANLIINLELDGQGVKESSAHQEVIQVGNPREEVAEIVN